MASAGVFGAAEQSIKSGASFCAQRRENRVHVTFSLLSQVQEKKMFNDRGQRALGLVSGDVWYSQQAFRALNQVS